MYGPAIRLKSSARCTFPSRFAATPPCLGAVWERPATPPSVHVRVVEQKSIAVQGEDERGLQRFRVREGLLHPAANSVSVVLGFDHRERKARFVFEDIIRSPALASAEESVTHDDASVDGAELLANLILRPSGPLQRRCDAPSAHLRLGQVSILQSISLTGGP